MKPFTARLVRLALGVTAGGIGGLLADELLVRIPEADMKKAAITRVNPEYPALARQLRLSGRAEVEVYVTPEGDVDKVQPVSGNPVFTSSAVTAMKKWKFTPFKADGKPARAVGTLAFDFHQ
jgi:protein TonB